ncbi:neutral/alkaline non-lysosomal ceramidase N-terminal domain-containing protein [Aquiflexum gelatinilyticum]|uniref:neutral/alkaline non-lysosomal ceramidase N-terminal domain-containing protein n=1 Tax=Aquiflexum gelatinilyticum TaxID=2961943 RepID=UPI0021688510|nr:neutral/alkaline non-lysosomal ceramidase N-terminal domain-containing protein [Aquiflexum gelatinilyticum]MCS4433692.1 alkaline ceramidase [Aquiflexum gelatinilyticum]
MPRPIAQRIFRVFGWTFGIVVFLALATLTRIDWRDFKEMDYYQETVARLDSLNFESSEGEIWLAGWSSVNATPSSPAKLVGYKPRGRYEFVLDSSFVKAMVISNGKSTVAFLNYELMIVHPYLQGRINQAINESGLALDYVYFTATHTHSGIGGHIPGLIGKLAFGGYDDKIVKFLEAKTLEGLKSAMASRDTVEVYFRKTKADTLVANRLIAEDPIDPYIRQLIFEKRNGKKGTILTYSAHPTILNSKFMGLSGDYPNYLTKLMEKGEYDFSLFAAGTVGSHRPVATGNQTNDVESYALALNRNLSENIHEVFPVEEPNLKVGNLPVGLRKAHFRISEKVRIRPWIFNSVFGDTNAHFDIVQIGKTLFISSSGEISGVFMKEWEDYATEKGFHLIITCFNGGYIGYITPDKYYNYPLYEVRDMNWFGPYNGAYFDEMIRKMIDKAAE